MDPPRPPLQNPMSGTTIDTDASTLHLHEEEDNKEMSQSVVDRIIRKTSQVTKSGHRKLNSLSRRVKSPHEASEQNGTHEETSGDTVDPFAQPTSNPPSRPSLNASFRGEGSLRMGTQTLIQALQAIPWSDVEEGPNDKDDSDENDADHKPAFTLSSSIHTIHRPVARIHKRSKAAAPIASSDDDSSIEEEEDDFDIQAPPLGVAAASPLHITTSTQPTKGPTSMSDSRTMMRRTTSLATVKVQKRAKLAEKLKAVFEIAEIEEVTAEMPCWLLRSVLLQGYMYLTNSHICFFAHMPSRENQILKSGSLAKKAQRTKRWNKHWFVLKNDALTWFHSSADPYFPHGVVDLRYAISCEPHGEKGIRVRTNQKTVNLEADSVPSRDEWVKSIRKVIFQAQNLGDNVKIAIPYSAVLELEKSKAMDFSETIEIKVLDKEDSCVDSYFFAYFHNLDLAVEEIRQAVQKGKSIPRSSAQETVKDTTSNLHAPPPPPVQQDSLSSTSQGTLSSVRDRLSAPVGKLGSMLRPVASAPTPPSGSRPTSMLSSDSGPMFTSPASTTPIQGASDNSAKSTWSVPVGVPSWLKAPSRRFFFSSPDSTTTALAQGDIGDIHETSAHSTLDHADFGFSIVDGVDSNALDPMTVDKFRAAFAFDEKETLLAEIPGYLFRVLPVFGRVNISSNYFCFRSSQPLTKTRMMIPIRDILSTENAKAFRFGHHGLVVVIKGHEELFFEFNSTERRNACAELLAKLVEECRERQRFLGTSPHPVTRQDSLVLETLTETETEPNSPVQPPPESQSEALPAVMFTSLGSAFLTFKPQESLRFTCLTIGSRGDVQPYIALAKGLQADGHRVKIATHLEFKDWIEGHGIEFGYVGGDPAELIRICVENGTFTVAFLREGLSKFRDWLDDLLATSWDACQNTDVLIESPSAMGGIHIAEALQIPYFRAFTMPWTRTRAYPHAFAVPENKMGGSYNYLTYVMFDQVFWRAISGQINRWRKVTLGIPPTTMDKQEAHKVPFLYNFSPSVVPPPLDWYEWIRVTGYWFLDDSENSTAKKWEPPAELLKFIETARADNKKIVYIGFGSIVVSDPDAMTKCILEAVKKSGVRAIMSKGWSDRLSTKKADVNVNDAHMPLPPEVHNIAAVPHDWLFSRIDAACHHGGAGTTGASLRAGIPTIIRPFFGDQFFWADRVEALGIGAGVRKLTVEGLTTALVNATTDTKQIARAAAIGKAIRAENGVATAVESIYRDLEYARSIIKFSQEHHDSDGTEGLVEAPHDDVRSNRALSDDWNLVDEGHLENGKDHGGILSPLKRVSLGLSGLTNNLHHPRH